MRPTAWELEARRIAEAAAMTEMEGGKFCSQKFWQEVGEFQIYMETHAVPRFFDGLIFNFYRGKCWKIFYLNLEENRPHWGAYNLSDVEWREPLFPAICGWLSLYMEPRYCETFIAEYWPEITAHQRLEWLLEFKAHHEL